MGRVKLNMHLISNEKARLTTFQKRKSGLIKKAYELQTLCSVDVCLIIYDPKICESPSSQPKIWPLDNHEKVKRMIESYKRQSMEDQKKRTNDLLFYFEDRNKKIEDKLVKLRKKNNEILYPSWEERYDNFSEDELRNIANNLQNKFNEVRVRFNMMRNIDGNNDHVSHQLGFLLQNQQISPYLMNEAMLGFFRESIAYTTPPTMMLMNGNNNDYYVNVNDNNGYEQNFFNQTDNFSNSNNIYPHTNPPISYYPMDNKMNMASTPDIYQYPSLEYYGPQMPQLPETGFMTGTPFQGYNMDLATQDNNMNGFSNVINGCHYGSCSNN